MRCQLYPWLEADGPTQMAIDEWLLEQAALGQASLRFYGWQPATLSLGYFQQVRDIRADPALGGLPVVRRATGGGAIVHDRELTYAFALPPGVPRDPHRPWTCRMHDLLRQGIDECGAPSQPLVCGRESGRGAFLCFEHQTPGDLIQHTHKIAGSAQRQRAGALLQHGSLLLAASPHAPHLLSIQDLTGVSIPAPSLASRLAELVAELWHWDLQTARFSPRDLERVEELRQSRYLQTAWNQRR